MDRPESAKRLAAKLLPIFWLLASWKLLFRDRFQKFGARAGGKVRTLSASALGLDKAARVAAAQRGDRAMRQAPYRLPSAFR